MENQLRYIAKKKSLRMKEFFRDFDSLRSGYVASMCDLLRFMGLKGYKGDSEEGEWSYVF